MAFLLLTSLGLEPQYAMVYYLGQVPSSLIVEKQIDLRKLVDEQAIVLYFEKPRYIACMAKILHCTLLHASPNALWYCSAHYIYRIEIVSLQYVFFHGP